MKKTLISLALALSLSPLVQAKTSVWQVSNGTNTVMIGGTVHILTASDYPLPCEFDSAYGQADEIVLEADIAKAQTPEFMSQYAARFGYTDGSTILDRISPATGKALTSMLNEMQLPVEQFTQLKPGPLMTMVTMMSFLKLGMTTAGVDAHFQQRAEKDSKPIAFLESAESQMEMLIRMGQGNEENLVKNIVESQTKIEAMLSGMMTTWRNGDMPGLAEVSETDEMKSETPGLFKELLVDRNNAWLPQIEKMLKTPEVEYVLVGALHLATDVGLVKQLQQRGYQVEQLDGCTPK